MRPQDLFDKVATHLFKQGHRAINQENGSCAYRSQNGSCCAVGALIPDDKYKPEMEGYDAEGLINTFPLDIPDYFTTHRRLLTSLQGVHDSGSNRVYDEKLQKMTQEFDKESLYKKLADVAMYHGLNTEHLETFRVHQ